MTPFRDSHLQPHFATHLRNPHSRPTFRDSTRDSLLRLMFATPLATPISDSRSRLHSRLMFATPDRAPNSDSPIFLSRLPTCDSTTDGRTVLSPHRHLPSVPTLTLKKTIFWNLLPGLASTSSYYPPSCPPPLVTLCLLTHPLAHYLLQRPLPPPPPCQDHCQHPHLYYPLCPPLHSSCLGTCH